LLEAFEKEGTDLRGTGYCCACCERDVAPHCEIGAGYKVLLRPYPGGKNVCSNDEKAKAKEGSERKLGALRLDNTTG